MSSHIETNFHQEKLPVMPSNQEKAQKVCARYAFLILLLISVAKVDAQQRTIITIDDASNVGFGKNNMLSSELNAVINGGLVHSDDTYVGAFVDNRSNGGKIKLVDPKNNDGNFGYKNAVLGKTIQGQMQIFEYGDPQLDTLKFEWAFQNGPFLLKDSENPHNENSNNKKNRAGMGYTADKKLVYIKTNEAVTFHEFANLFLQEGVLNAIYLDGGAEEYIGFSAQDENNITYTDEMKKERPVLQFFHTNIDVQQKK